MKKIITLVMMALALCSCENGVINSQTKKEVLAYDLSAENYEKFFKHASLFSKKSRKYVV